VLALRRLHGEAEARRRARAILARLRIDSLAARRVGLLAHGQRQLVELAMVVSPEPEMIILDEPTAGMSAEETDRAAGLIRDLNRHHTIVVVEHDMQFIRAIARTVTVLHQGRVLVEDSVDRVLADERVQDVYLGKPVASDASP
jgi:branched-chain amino acid transport system ATP-binding protein/urea transport system ATP-binding protein